MIRLWLIACLGFLYLPLAVLIAGSFNAERLAGVWGGFSWRWYRQVLADERLLEAALLSLKIAALSATIATILGFLAGYALSRARLHLRPVFAGLLAAPLILPDLLIGFSFVLLFVLAGIPRGAATITAAHATIGMAYVAVVIQARLSETGTHLEDAARDLGASEIEALWRITIPLAAPALAAGWLLAFTVSMDDLVVASFTAGPGATTLPMVVFSALRLGATPALAAIATLTLTVLIAAMLAARLLRRALSNPRL